MQKDRKDDLPPRTASQEAMVKKFRETVKAGTFPMRRDGRPGSPFMPIKKK